MPHVDKQELYKFAEKYDKFPDLASNIAADAQDSGAPDSVVSFYEALGDTYIENKNEALNIVEQIDVGSMNEV